MDNHSNELVLVEYQHQNILLKSILESPKGIIIFSLDTQYCYTSFTTIHIDVMRTIWGENISIGMSMLECIKDPKDRKKAKENFDKALKGQYIIVQEEYGDDTLSRKFWENRYSPIYNQVGAIIGLTVFVTDITQQKISEEELRLALLERELLLNSIGEGVYGVDTQGKCMFINPKALSILGFTKEEVIGCNTHMLFHHHFPDGTSFPQEKCVIHSVIEQKEQQEVRDWLFKKNGEIIPVRIIATPILRHQQFIGVVISFNDVSVQYQMEKDLQKSHAILKQQATTDSLTQIYNRRYIEEFAPKMIEQLIGQGDPISMIAFDIDYFKSINDRYGHHIGDSVIVMLTQTIKLKLRSIDVFVRIGGDEFIILLPFITLKKAVKVGNRIQEAVRQSVCNEGDLTISCTISMGVVQADESVNHYEDLVKAVDIKLYEAKSAGKNCIRF